MAYLWLEYDDHGHTLKAKGSAVSEKGVVGESEQTWTEVSALQTEEEEEGHAAEKETGQDEEKEEEAQENHTHLDVANEAS